MNDAQKVVALSSWEDRAFGRVPHIDGRDRNFSVARAVRATPTRLPKEKFYDQDVWWGDQGSTSRCTAFGWMGSLLDSRIIRPVAGKLPSDAELTDFYCEEQARDPWPGDCQTPPQYDGTTVRAGASTAVTRGWIKGYLWAFGIVGIRSALIDVGEVVIGIDWYEGMSQTDANGVMTVTGNVEGGHCVRINGFVRAANADHWYRIKNSWSQSWGDKGNGWIRESELVKLIDPTAEFCVPIPASRVDVQF